MHFIQNTQQFPHKVAKHPVTHITTKKYCQNIAQNMISRMPILQKSFFYTFKLKPGGMLILCMYIYIHMFIYIYTAERDSLRGKKYGIIYEINEI